MLDVVEQREEPPAVDPAAVETTPGRTPGRLPMFIASAVIVTLARWWFTADRHIFHVSPDEPSQLAVARWLAGGTRWNMFDHATWQPGLALLLTPAYWFTDDGETVVRFALFLNCVSGGLAAVLLALVIRRLTSVSATTAAIVSTVVAIAPSSLSASSFVWAESLVSLTFLATVLALLRFHESRAVAPGAVAIASAVAGYSVHSRLLPLIGTTVLLTVGIEWWHRRWRRGAMLAVVAGALTLGSAWWKDWVLTEVWESPSNQNTVGAVWRRARQPLDLLDAILGQAWYQMTATLGLATIGAFVLGRACVRRTSVAPGHAAPLPTDRIGPGPARILAVTTVPLLLLSAVFMSDRPRPDQLIYGRYNDAVMWPIVALGLVWVVGRIRSGLSRRDLVLVGGTLATMLVTGAVVDRLHGDAIAESYGVRGMIAGLLAFVDGDDALRVWRTTVVATIIATTAVLVIAIASRSTRARPAVLTLGIVVGLAVYGIAAVRTERVANLRLNGWQASSAVQTVDDLVPDGVALAVRTVPTSEDPAVSWTTQRQRYQVYQFYLSDREFLRDRGVDDEVGPYVFAPLGTEELVSAGAELIWTDPSVRIGLWLEPDTDSGRD